MENAILKAPAEVIAARERMNTSLRYGGQPMINLSILFFNQTEKEVRRWFTEVFEIFPEMPSFEETRRQVLNEQRAMTESEYIKSWGIQVEKHGDHYHYNEAQITTKAIPEDFIRLYGQANWDKLNNSTKRLIERYVGKGPRVDDRVIYDTNIWKTIQRTFRVAYNDALQAWRRLSARQQAANPFKAVRDAIINPQSDWVRSMYSDGFERVTSSITKQALENGIARRMVIMHEAEVPWNTIARALYKQEYEGKLWHWQRLVRTEMARAIDVAQVERYKQAGGNFVRWNMARNGCPICEPFWAGGSGYYRIEDSPTIPPHPNCRCFKSIVYRLPVGTQVYTSSGSPAFIIQPEI